MEATTPSPSALIGFAIAHEVRNLLTPACAYLEMAKAEPGSGSDSVSRAQAAIERAIAFADTVLSAKPNARCDIAAAATGAVQSLHPSPSCRVIVDIPNDAMAAMPQPVLERVIANLVANSLEAFGKRRGEIRVRCFPWNAGWRIEVSDDGPGLPSKRDARPNRGRGLQICLFLVEQAGGSLDIESSPGAGCRVTLDLPRAEMELARQAA
jgi:signal transduction histidine kinase